LGTEWGLPLNYQAELISTFDNKLYASIGESLYILEGTSFNKIHEEPGYKAIYMTPVSDRVLVGWQCISGCNDKKILLNAQGMAENLQIDCASKTLNVISDEQGRLWIADENTGFKYLEELTGPCNTIIPNRPPTHNVSELDVYRGKLYIASGGVSPNYGYLFRTDGFYTNAGDKWQSVNIWNNPLLAERDMRDFLVVKVSSQGKAFIGTFWDGLIEWENQALTVYDQSNSSLQNSVINPDRNRISGLAFDTDENLWVLNHDAPEPVSVRTADGNWQSFPIPYPTNVEHIAIDHENNKWISIGGVGLLVYDSGPDLLSGSDDQFRLFNASNSALTVNSINCIATDRQGAVWVGTTSGPVIFDCSNFVFDGHCQGNRLIVVSNGIAGELLGNENIRSIAVDGGDRKWFGTTNGVFVQSSDGENQIHVFHTKNSPLFDNQIIDIGMDQNKGEVFIATNKGILSYKGEATEGTAIHSNNILVFPNPVRPEYRGPIAIRGLAENALIKITDINGFLVFETRAIGGQALWYGNDLNGNRVNTGVYLVFSTITRDFADPDSAVTKIMFFN
jgi:ligand-binding sensor domain-containing protein